MRESWRDLKLFNCIKENRHLIGELSDSEAIELSTRRVSDYLFNDFSCNESGVIVSLLKKLTPEIRQFFKTGICGQVDSSTTTTSANPTFLKPTTGKWLLSYASCPFRGFFPLPFKALLDAKEVKNGFIADFCKDELKKLLTAFRKRMNKIMFYFHPCDALAFCYGDLPYKFDIIDTSTLADTLGLANLLNAAGRKLLSDQSLLITESMEWMRVAPSVAQYVFRLMDNVELGQNVPRSNRTIAAMPSRLRWKKAMPFDQVPLVLTPSLETCLHRLMSACCLRPSQDTAYLKRESFCWPHFSSLTFCYVLSNLIQRGGITTTSSLWNIFIAPLRPVFRKSFEICRAWMENRPVWRVNLRATVSPALSKIIEDEMACRSYLRLVLVPAHVFSSLDSASTFSRLTDLNSTVNHFINNAQFRVKVESSGLIEWADISFLLDDCSLLKTHAGIFVTPSGSKTFSIDPLSDCIRSTELFALPYPWHCENPTTHPSASGSSKSLLLTGESCEETEDAYTIRFKIVSGGSSKPLSGINDCFTDL